MANRQSRRTRRPASGEATLRIVGGSYRGRKLLYSGDPGVRPMKDRIRESLFNLLGPGVKNTFALDLFGGTGALTFEAISRGATAGIIVERHLPTARIIRENIRSLQLEQRVQLVTASAFHWVRDRPPLPADPWVVFCSPPYRLYTEQARPLSEMLHDLYHTAPAGSLFAVEAGEEFEGDLLPAPDTWDIRCYPPAWIAVATVTANEQFTPENP